MNETNPIILIVGPTAGGKTSLAIELALQLPGGGECICADSMQIYKGMDIGTAKPSPADCQTVPHHLLNIADPAEDGFSVDHWLRLAEKSIADIRAMRCWPIVVGGTNLYVKALLEGLFDGPESDPTRRAELDGTDPVILRKQLEKLDPVAASRIHPNDRKRTIRAIEVYERTGRPISEHQIQWSNGQNRTDIILIGLNWPVETINRRINARVKVMFQAGLVDEVRNLQQAGRLSRQASEALGYKQVIEFLDQKCSLDEAIEQVKIRTRRFAKQQRSWLRRFGSHNRSIWISAGEISAQDIVNQALTFIIQPYANLS